MNLCPLCRMPMDEDVHDRCVYECEALCLPCDTIEQSERYVALRLGGATTSEAAAAIYPELAK